MRPRRRYHFHLPGVIYVFVTLLLALGAFNSQNNMLFWAFGFALSLLLISGMISGAMLMGLSVTRRPAVDATAGRPMVIRYSVRNRNRLVPAFALRIEEMPAQTQGRFGRGGPVAEEPPATWVRRLTRPVAFVAHVGPGQTVTAEAVVRPDRRGAASFYRYRVVTTFPFGLVKKSLEFAEQRTTIIRPAPIPADESLVNRPRHIGGAGARPMHRRGEGEEFFALREYISGDSPRSIAWKPSARLQRLHVRQNTAPVPDLVWIVLGLTRDATEDEAERAIGIAATLVDAAGRRNLEVGLCVPAAGLVRRPRAGKWHIGRLLNDLALIDLGALSDGPAPGPPGRLPTRDTIVVVHAGPVRRDGWPPRSRHVSSLEAAA